MPQLIEIPPCLTMEGAAARLGVSRMQIERWLRDGKLAAVRPHRRCTLIPLAALMEFERERQAKKES
jgi:excisionase family DNA binding protein